ncbi:MAG: lysine--tRNA ligase [bacterium]|nr:lysine--tRNA ligase [bacterium]
MQQDTKEGLEKLKQFRVEKLEALREAGINPYPYKYDVKHVIESLVSGEEALTKDETLVRVAGRIMAMRGHGKTTFGHIEDRTGRIQFYIRKDDIGEDRFKIFKLLEVGDIAGIEGVMFRTKTDELTIRFRDFEVLAKGLRPLPEKWHGLQDTELRYRQRYVDLLMNADVRKVFMTRARIVETIRQFLNQRGYLEVETPILQPLYGGAAARPFTTHHNSLDIDLYLRIADELYLKRLLVGGLERVFEFSKDFRNEGIDRTHFPEFTMMECYAAYKDYEDYMNMVEEMLQHVAKAVTPDGKVVYNGHTVDFTKPWKRMTFFDALKEETGIDFRGLDEAAVFSTARDLKIDIEKGRPLATMLDDIFSERVEPKLLDPTFVYDYPKELSPLAKDHRSEEGLVERFEPFMVGFEVGNAFSELNDPLEQKRRFEAQAEARARGDEEAHVIDADYVRAMEYGMPPAAGLGIGIDRLTMVLTDSASIRDVLLFPQMRPE